MWILSSCFTVHFLLVSEALYLTSELRAEIFISKFFKCIQIFVLMVVLLLLFLHNYLFMNHYCPLLCVVFVLQWQYIVTFSGGRRVSSAVCS